ncbi:uncharacterized protein LOC123317337 [Coccinella septempunctata]|uniref:uncharacterized protein LOC123317337 n=1 Tax=Coccinella septempunctata TaxID=41139 RepID=UPI001D076757|nr:uncharacterized protein LOC123317337 [Coccinella septempunctata]
MNKLFGLYLILFLLSLAASFDFSGDRRFRELWNTCNPNSTQVVCTGHFFKIIICGSDGKSYSDPSIIRCLNNCLPKEEKVTVVRLGFCERENDKEKDKQKEYMKMIGIDPEQMEKFGKEIYLSENFGSLMP